VRVGSRPVTDPIIFNTDAENTIESLTFLDSGTSDHCVADKSLFAIYSSLEELVTGLSAGKGSTFNIIGKRNISFNTTIDGITRKIVINNVLHTPSLQSNLISVSRLSSMGADVTFNEDKAIVRLKSGEKIMLAKKIGQLYALKMNRPPNAFVTQSKRKPVTFNIWHRCFVHTGVEKLKEMVVDDLVDGLNVHGELKLNSQCEDCIFGKHALHPYSSKGNREKNVLKRIHIDI